VKNKGSKIKIVMAAVFVFILLGCSAHNPFIIINTTQSSPASNNQYPVYTGKVFITEQSLPVSIEFDLISTVDVGKVWYGSSNNVYTSMADKARALGANAIIQAKTWYQPSGFSWAAPHGSGQAIKIKDMNKLEPLAIKGNWY
jgi:hypothetical protein